MTKTIYLDITQEEIDETLPMIEEQIAAVKRGNVSLQELNDIGNTSNMLKKAEETRKSLALRMEKFINENDDTMTEDEVTRALEHFEIKTNLEEDFQSFQLPVKAAATSIFLLKMSRASMEQAEDLDCFALYQIGALLIQEICNNDDEYMKFAEEIVVGAREALDEVGDIAMVETPTLGEKFKEEMVELDEYLVR